jgi:hypothetical protein
VLEEQLASVKQPTQIPLALQCEVAPEQLASVKHCWQKPELTLQMYPDLQSVFAVQALLVDFVSHKIMKIINNIKRMIETMSKMIAAVFVFFFGGC